MRHLGLSERLRILLLMNHRTLIYLLPLFLSLALWQLSHAVEQKEKQADASDNGTTNPRTDPEAVIIAQLKNSVEKRQLVELTLSSGTFPALYTEETRGQTEGGLILLHDIDANADWPGVISPLRHGLPDRGWHTLSLQLPLYPGKMDPASLSALIKRAMPRINSAIDYYHAQSITNIVFIGHGFGATLAAAWLAQDQQSRIQGLVTVGMQGMTGEGEGEDEKQDTTRQLENLTIPILDIVGSRDLETVVTAATKRKTAMRRSSGKTANPSTDKWPPRRYQRADDRYLQVQVAGADHNFTDLAPFLERRIWGWLKQHASGTENLQ